MSPQELTREGMATLGYICSACLKPADKCRCPWQENKHGIEVQPARIHRDSYPVERSEGVSE